MSLYDSAKRDVQTDVFRLKNVELVVTTAEQLAKAREKVADINGSVQLKVTWTPLTYRKFIGDDEVTEEVDYIKMTKSAAVSDEALPLLREGGLARISKDMLINLPAKPERADVDKQPQPFSRFMVAAAKAGIVINQTPEGGVTSPQIGSIFSCRNGYEEFPSPNSDIKGFWDWDDTSATFMRIPVAEVKDFVQPDELREYRYERKDDEAAGAAATTTTSGGAVTDEDVAVAVRALGINGKPVSLINNNGLGLVSGKVAEYRALAVLMPAASANGLVDELVRRGIATVEGDLLAVA